MGIEKNSQNFLFRVLLQISVFADKSVGQYISPSYRMNQKPRIPKSDAQKLNDCETHIYFLWDAHRLYSQQRERFKQIAAELRILVCETRHNKPLLLDMMDKYSFKYEVQPTGLRKGGPPLKPQPLPIAGWRSDAIQMGISEELSKAIKSGDKKKMIETEKKLAELAKPTPFREWVTKGLAVYIKPYEYSNQELTLAIAQQFGSSHEDNSIEEPIVRLQQIIIGGETSDIAPMIEFAVTVIHVGKIFISHLVNSLGYAPRYFKF